MRPVFHLAAKLLLAASFAGFADQAFAQTGHKPKPVLQSLSRDAQEDLAHQSTGNLIWFSNPEKDAATPAQKSFMKKLTHECAKMGLPFVPHVFVFTPDPPDRLAEKPAAPTRAVGSTIDDGGGPLIWFRNAIFGEEKSILTEDEAIALADHELWVLKVAWDGKHAPQPAEQKPPSDSELLAENRTIANQADLNTVKMGHGNAFMIALREIDDFNRADYNRNLTPKQKAAGFTYVGAMNEQSVSDVNDTLIDRLNTVNEAIANRAHKPLVMRPIVRADIDDVYADAEEKYDISWFSDPKNQAAKSFMKGLALDCKRMGLPFVPHVLIITNKSKPTTIDDLARLALSKIDDSIGPIIIFRGDFFGAKNAVLTKNEALAIADHELWHLFISHNGTHPSEIIYPIGTPKNIITAEHQHYLELARKEELAADHNAVTLGRGHDFHSAYDKMLTLNRADFYAVQPTDKQLKGYTYESWMMKQAKDDDHPLDDVRQTTILKDLAKERRGFVQRLFAFH